MKKWTWQAERDWGRTMLGIWLIATGLVPLLNIRFDHLGTILAVLAIVAGVLILMRR